MKLEDVKIAYEVEIIEFDLFESMKDEYLRSWTPKECQNWWDCLNNKAQTGFVVEYGIVQDDRPQFRKIRWHQPTKVWAVTGSELNETLLDQVLAGQTYRVA